MDIFYNNYKMYKKFMLWQIGHIGLDREEALKISPSNALSLQVLARQFGSNLTMVRVSSIGFHEPSSLVRVVLFTLSWNIGYALVLILSSWQVQMTLMMNVGYLKRPLQYSVNQVLLAFKLLQVFHVLFLKVPAPSRGSMFFFPLGQG